MFLIVLLLRFLIHASPFVEEYQENCYSDNPSSMITNRILSGMGCISFGAVFYESTCFEGLGEVYFYTDSQCTTLFTTPSCYQGNRICCATVFTRATSTPLHPVCPQLLSTLQPTPPTSPTPPFRELLMIYTDGILQQGVIDDYICDNGLVNYGCHNVTTLLFNTVSPIPDQDTIIYGIHGEILFTSWGEMKQNIRESSALTENYWWGQYTNCLNWTSTIACGGADIVPGLKSIRCSSYAYVLCICVNGIPLTRPSQSPTNPTQAPTRSPTVSNPTKTPTTSIPTKSPSSSKPTTTPTTSIPTKSPSHSPTRPSTLTPSLLPTTLTPTLTPTTLQPTQLPTKQPTILPTTLTPTLPPTLPPTLQPTTLSPTSLTPTLQPTNQPTLLPTTLHPSLKPSNSPSRSPSRPTSQTPTIKPSITTFAPNSLVSIDMDNLPGMPYSVHLGSKGISFLFPTANLFPGAALGLTGENICYENVATYGNVGFLLFPSTTFNGYIYEWSCGGNVGNYTIFLYQYYDGPLTCLWNNDGVWNDRSQGELFIVYLYCLPTPPSPPTSHVPSLLPTIPTTSAPIPAGAYVINMNTIDTYNIVVTASTVVVTFPTGPIFPGMQLVYGVNMNTTNNVCLTGQETETLTLAGSYYEIFSGSSFEFDCSTYHAANTIFIAPISQPLNAGDVDCLRQFSYLSQVFWIDSYGGDVMDQTSEGDKGFFIIVNC